MFNKYSSEQNIISRLFALMCSLLNIDVINSFNLFRSFNAVRFSKAKLNIHVIIS